MSSVNVTQLIEKEKLTDSPTGFWRNEENEEQITTNPVYENRLTETGSDVLSANPECQTKTDEEVTNTLKDIEKDSDESPLGSDQQRKREDDDTVEDADETDYFDSEDEYWETHRDEGYTDEYNEYHYHPTQTGKDGRYSRGVKQYENLPLFRRSIRKFAADNNFEVKDVIADGNCLFRSVADQLMINGCSGYTEKGLRQTAIKYLRSNTTFKDGVHASSFLSGETLEGYLTRMEKPGEWGDHIILQALADVLMLDIVVFNVFLDDIRTTEVTAELDTDGMKTLRIYLGHLGEFHYVSLRPKQWMEDWPYKALILRLQTVSEDMDVEMRKTLIEEKVLSMSRGTRISEATLNDIAQFAIQTTCRKEGRKTGKSFTVKGIAEDFNPQITEETEVSQRSLIENPLHTDHLSGIPLHQLTFIMKHLIPHCMSWPHFFGDGRLFRSGEHLWHFIGSAADGNSFVLQDITHTQKMHKLSMDDREKVKIVVLQPDKTAFCFKPKNYNISPAPVFADCTDTHPGYCRIRLSPTQSNNCRNDNILRSESNIYLKAKNIPADILSQIGMIKCHTEYFGLFCPVFPRFTRCWCDRTRKFDFPSKKLVDSIITSGCTIIPKPHPKSSKPDVEWKFNFSLAEYLLFSSLTESQQNGFFVFKVLIDNMLFHLHKPLKTKHLKAIFLNSCEEMPIDAWETNFSGCVLYTLGSLLFCLRARFLPHYFNPDNNLIDTFTEMDIDAIYVHIESIRLFPTTCAMFVAEKHGYGYGENLVRHVLSDLAYFTQARDLYMVYNNTFVPLSLATTKFLSRKGHYDAAFKLIKDIFEQGILTPTTEMRQTSISYQDFFVSALLQLRQKSSRTILANMYDKAFGTKLLDMFWKETDFSLQKFLPWKIDHRLTWIEIPREKARDLTTIANVLYGHSLKECDKRNKILAELTVTAAIRCIRDTLRQDILEISHIEDPELKEEVVAQKRSIKARLKLYYIQVYDISSIDYMVYPLNEHISDIEELYEEFPEMSGILSSMFSYLGQKQKSRKYASKCTSYLYGNAK
ncbi:uncharacterized protein LOC125655301 isoform X1 [Ostrea edulis]|uniref:uncharacterized protein LOC125655301 isoform X1 n=1 Tax=Ostrea edulis TaxID=37623 RepID=UPI0024AF3A1F|nr:uncharacterized protein LOC125655301 isoform X1 [Ostrea edulis]